MRNISIAALEELATTHGIEPINIIEVQWAKDGPWIPYAEKTVDGVEGRIIAIQNLQDVINVSKSGTSQSVSLTLDDTDGQLKSIYNQNDIHKKKVRIYQWFVGLPLTDKFLIFAGIIASPVIWKEGDRTLTFSVISKVEDAEVGFSIEDGTFDFVPQDAIGKGWPLVFGQVKKLPALLLDDIPYGSSTTNSRTGKEYQQGDIGNSVVTDPVGISDPSLAKRIAENEAQAAHGVYLAKLYFIGYLQASFTARRRGELGEFDTIERGRGTFSGLARQYLQLANKALFDAQSQRNKNGTLQTVLNRQREFEPNSVRVTNGSKFPQGQNVNISIGGAIHAGYFTGDTFNITDRYHPAYEKFQDITIVPVLDRTGAPVLPRDEFFFADGGTPVRISTTTVRDVNGVDVDVSSVVKYIRYVVSAGTTVTVDNVFAMLNGVLTLVPPDLYEVYTVTFGTLPTTMIIMRPLSTRGAWEDEIYVNATSTIGPNTGDILQWLIETYTDSTVDPTTFTAVKSALIPYPSHFAIMDRRNILKVLQEIAYQARCLIWLKNDVFYIKYLPKKETAVDTITANDILENSLEVSYTETEDIVTKMIAEWRADYRQSNPNKIILRYNVAYYGTIEERENYYIYNMQQLVVKSTVFWLIRKANTFKRVTFSTPLHKLNIETLDTVTFDVPGIVANAAVDCFVEEANYDSANNTMKFVLWVPVRAGEMIEYLFAYPSQLDVSYVFPTIEDETRGRVSSGRGINRDVRTPTAGSTDNPILETPFTGDEGNGSTINDTSSGNFNVGFRPHAWGGGGNPVTDTINTTPEIINRIDDVTIRTVGTTKPTGTTNYTYDQPDIREQIVPLPGTTVLPGYIRGGSDGNWTVDAYYNGISRPPTSITGVKAPQGTDFAEGTGVLILELVFTLEGETVVEHYIQPAVWQ